MANQEIKLVITGEDRTQQAILATGNGLKYLEGAVTKLAIQFSALGTAWNQAMMVVRKGLEYIDLGAKAIRAEEAFRAMADAAEINADRLSAAMKKAADGMIDDSDLMQRAAFAMAQDIDPNKIPQLLEAARIAARKTGKDVGDAVDGMIQGIATNMPRSLRQMGAISKEQMNLLNKAVAEGVTEINLLDLVLANAAVDMAKLGPSANNAAKDIKRFKTELVELKEALGKEMMGGLQYLLATFQSVAGFALSASSALFSLMKRVGELRAIDAEKKGNHDLAAKLRAAAKEWEINAVAADSAAYNLYKKAETNFYGDQNKPDTRSAAQKKKDIATAEADRAAVLAEIQAAIDKAKADKKAEQDAEAAAKAADKLKERWVDTVRTLNAQIAGEGVDEFEKKLIDIQKESEKLKEEFKTIPGAAALIEQATRALENEAATEQAKKDFDEYLKKLDEARRAEKEAAEERKKANLEWKAAQEALINQQLAELDIAEKLGTAHNDTLEERIRLTKALLEIQKTALDKIDRAKDPTAWNTQADKEISTRKGMGDLSRDAMMKDPFSAIKLGLKDIANEAMNTGKQLYDAINSAFSGMTESLTDFVMTGKANFSDLANSIIRDMARIMIQRSITAPLATGVSGFLTGLFGGGSVTQTAGTGGAFTQASGGQFAVNPSLVMGQHSGGMGNEPTFFRIVPNPDILPRYHKGLGPGERFAITTDEESTMTPGQRRDFFKMASQFGSRDNAAPAAEEVHVHLTVNALDSRSVSQALAQHQNEIVGLVNIAYNKRGQRGPLGS